MSLQDRSIVITRPIDQCLEIASKIEELNGKPIIFPCIEIEALDSNEAWQALKTDLEIIDLAIFVSSNAVSHGLTPLLEFAPQSLHVAAVGSGTSKQLQDMGIDKVLSPEGQFDSESLLELPELQQANNILIIKGVGGRTLLKETLQERGANVFSIDVYQRRKPSNNNSDLLNQYLDLILFFSKESVENMLSMLPNKLHRTNLELPNHSRALKYCNKSNISWL